MSALNFPGPICQYWRWFDLDDGTLARMPSPAPATIGLTESEAEESVVASGDCSFLNPRLFGTVRVPQAAFDRLRGNSSAATVSSPQPIDAQNWRDGSSSAAAEQEIQIDGQTIRIVRPVDADATGKNLPTTAQIAEALRAVPAHQRSYTSTVIVNPVAHPDSTSRRTIAGDAGSGTIFLYPVNSGQSQNDFDNRLMHESGHNYQGSLWHSGADVAEWGAAASSDSRRPSPYAAEGYGEDFCEFNILYIASRNTPCGEVGRQIYPHRWAKMVEYQSR